jgi:four helix bundle protein
MTREEKMEFDHEKLDVYKVSLKFAKLAVELIGTFPPGTANLSDQLKRASVSISLNIAEGAGEYSRSEKARFYRMSRRSATECAAIVDICKTLELGHTAVWTECRLTLLSIVSMLVKLIKSMNGDGAGQGQGQRHTLR